MFILCNIVHNYINIILYIIDCLHYSHHVYICCIFYLICPTFYTLITLIGVIRYNGKLHGQNSALFLGAMYLVCIYVLIRMCSTRRGSRKETVNRILYISGPLGLVAVPS